MDLDFDVYFELPQGCDCMSGRVVYCQSAVYGLRQPGRTWNLRPTETLFEKISVKLFKADYFLCVYAFRFRQ